LATVKSKGEESPVRLAGDCNTWMSKMQGTYLFLLLIDQKGPRTKGDHNLPRNKYPTISNGVWKFPKGEIFWQEGMGESRT
jgi:hypothetical protein